MTNQSVCKLYCDHYNLDQRDVEIECMMSDNKTETYNITHWKPRTEDFQGSKIVAEVKISIDRKETFY